MSYYPKWKYHRTLPACIVADAAAEAALGPDWEDTPAAFSADPEPEDSRDLAGAFFAQMQAQELQPLYISEDPMQTEAPKPKGRKAKR